MGVCWVLARCWGLGLIDIGVYAGCFATILREYFAYWVAAIAGTSRRYTNDALATRKPDSVVLHRSFHCPVSSVCFIPCVAFDLARAANRPPPSPYHPSGMKHA